MLISKSEMRKEERPEMRGGVGTTEIYHALEADPSHHFRLVGEVRLPAGASIGMHQHSGEREYFFFCSGSGVVDDDGVEKPVHPGDIMITGDGASHGVRNTGKDDLLFFAIIVTD
ncbi:MAG: cupin domain-containing protein [Spirochaetaceae bacterium]|jgi:mannose-6-phosphate isomerase-like protein (cupin superfamily)|nr:cupin domain-containing protein [Spirochaetaceae bacterium]